MPQRAYINTSVFPELLKIISLTSVMLAFWYYRYSAESAAAETTVITIAKNTFNFLNHLTPFPYRIFDSPQDTPNIFEKAAEKILEQAKENFRQGKYLLAEETIQHLLNKYSENITTKIHREVLNFKGALYLFTGKTKDAENTADEIIRLYPDETKAYVGKAIILRRRGAYDEGIKICHHVLSLDENNFDGLVESGKSYSAPNNPKRNLQKAENYFDRALRINKNNADALNGKGVCLFSRGQINPAQRYFEKALKNDANHMDALQNTASILYLQGEYCEAKEINQKILRLNARNSAALEQQERIDQKLEKMKKTCRMG